MSIRKIRVLLGGLLGALLVAGLLLEMAASPEARRAAAGRRRTYERPVPVTPPYFPEYRDGSLAVRNIEELRSGPGEPVAYQSTARRDKDTWRKGEKYQARFDLSWGFGNPYDPAVVAVDALIETPSGRRHTVPAFWYVPCTGRVVHRGEPMRDEEDTPQVEEIEPDREAAHWMLRYTPQEEGQYRYRIMVRTPTASATSSAVRFTVAGRANPGFVRVSSENPRYFEFEDSSPFIPVGLNVAWPNDLGSVDYGRYMATLRHYGANWARLWLTHFFRGTNIEWSRSKTRPYTHGLGFYSAEVAWRLDRMLESAETNGIYVAWCLQHHGQFSTRSNPDWPTNPYNRAAGGFLDRPEDFFTDARARELFRRRARYLVARYGYSPNIFAWELWNEVDLTDGYSEPVVTAWHDEMARYLKQIDPTGRMVTTSYASSYRDDAFRLENHDFRQVHYYQASPSSFYGIRARPIEDQMGAVEPDRLGKPVIIGEYGLGHDHSYFGRNADATWPVDPDGLHVHNSLWMGVFSGSAGTAMNWWWDRYLRENDLFFRLTGISRFLEGEDPRPLKNDVVQLFDSYWRTPPVQGYVLSGRERALGWLFEAAYTLAKFAPTGEPRRDVTIELEGLTDGPYRVEFWDTYDGVITATRRLTVTGGAVEIEVPPFRGDIAFKLVRTTPDEPLPEVHSHTPIRDRMIERLLELAEEFEPEMWDTPDHDPYDRWDEDRYDDYYEYEDPYEYEDHHEDDHWEGP